MKLSKSCLKLLDEADRRVDILLGNGGRKRARPFPAADAAPTDEDVDADDAGTGR